MVEDAQAAEPGDIELVRQFQAGQAEAFDRLFLRYHRAISSLTTRIVADPLMAEDLTQETFFRVLRSLDRVDESFNFSAWIHRIATNLCYDEIRRRKRAAPAQSQDDAAGGLSSDPDELLRALPSTDAGERPEEALEMRELRREVWRVARLLPDNYRHVLTLRELQGLTYGGIAEAMGISESAVETLLHRARKRFKLEYLFLDFTEADGDDRCVAMAELLAAFPLSALRRGQRAAVQEHAATCPRCGPLLAHQPG